VKRENLRGESRRERVVDSDEEILLRQGRRSATGVKRVQITRVIVEFLRIENAFRNSLCA
jgi:hypothetical protein